MTLDELKVITPGLLNHEVVKYETGKTQEGHQVITVVLVQKPGRVVPMPDIGAITGKR